MIHNLTTVGGFLLGRRTYEADLHVIGSTDLVQTLIEDDLVDEFRVMIDPVVLGGGKRIFRISVAGNE